MARFKFGIRSAMVVIAEVAVFMGLLSLAIRQDDTLITLFLVIVVGVIYIAHRLSLPRKPRRDSGT
jgi:hypothetical protein